MLEEIKELKQELIEKDRDYMRQNKLFLDSQRRGKEDDNETITKLFKEKIKEAVEQQRDLARKHLQKALEENNFKIIEVNELKKTINGALEERRQLVQDIKTKEDQLIRMAQAIEDLERQAELQREFIRDQSKTEEEIEAAKEKLEGIQERIAELESKKENLERVVGLTTREKIKRLLIRAGMGVVFAGAVSGIVSLILNIINPVGKALKKVGKKAEKGFKKLGNEISDVGKKMAASIPGLIGSVLSLILKTGGELLKFIGNNIWILVVAIGAVLLKWLTEKR